MSTNQGQPNLQELMSRVAALEQAHARLLVDMTSARGAPAPAAFDEQQLRVATALAPTPTQGNFASSVPGTPAVTASGTTGATGVQASSDRGFGVSGQSATNIGVSGQSNSGIGVEGSSTGSGTGVSGQSNSGIGVSGQSNTGLAGQFLGNVTVDGHLSSGAGTFASNVPGTPAVSATGTGVTGVQAVSDSGIGVSGQSTGSVGVLGRSSSGNGVGGGSESGAGVSGSSVSGPGLRGESTTGLAGEFIGNVSVSGNVGIGTNSPAYPLQVETVTDTYGITQTNGAITVGTYEGGGAGGGGFGTKSNHPLSFFINGNVGNPAITIATSGNVGIGPLAPQAKLDISGGAIEGLRITNTNENPFALMINNTTVGSTDATGFGLWQSDTGTAVLTNHNNFAVSIDPSGNVGIGTTTPSASEKLTVQGDVSVSANLTVGGNVSVTGDVVLTGADCAEEFDIAEAAEIEPGTVMVLDQDGALHQSRRAYDKMVAGVISGAGSYKPGLILDKRQSQDNRLPVALVGKVYCKVDARYAPIAVGDLLTTSSTAGHAMKAVDPVQAFGSVIGKALRPLEAGQGMIPILIALQ